MNRKRLRQLEKRRRRYSLEVLERLRSEAVGTPRELHIDLLQLLGSVLGELGEVEQAAGVLRKALVLANADEQEGRGILEEHDHLAKRPWKLYRGRAAGYDVTGALAEVLSAIDMPTSPVRDRDWLQEMDELRYERPQRTLMMLLPEVDRIPVELEALYLGVTGSTYRMRAGQGVEIERDLQRAEDLVSAGLWIAREKNDHSASADLLQRQAYIVGDRGQHFKALELAEQAGGVYDRIGDRAGRSKALVDQGLFLGHLSRPAEAIAAEERALELLPAEEVRNRAAAYQVVGVSWLQLGELGKALSAVDEAAQLAEGMSALALGKVQWLQGSIEAKLGRLEESTGKLGSAVELLRGVHYGEAALASTDLVRVLLLQGRSVEAFRIAQSMRGLVMALHRNPIVSSAIAELLRADQAALTLARVEGVRTTIAGERNRRDWLLLKAQPA